MSQFDQTTEKKAGEERDNVWHHRYPMSKDYSPEGMFSRGRNSTKASMEILARALQEIDLGTGYYGAQAREYKTIAAAAITKVKANGDWPLEDKV